MYFFTDISSAFFHANTSADIITPATTASARSQEITVIAVTTMITNASLLGIFGSILNVGQAKVPITTMNMSHTRAARGINAIYFVANTIRTMRNTEAEIPDIRPRPQFEILIIDCPIIAHHPIAPKNPHTPFAIPCPTDSLLLLPRFSVISSIKDKVISDSVSHIIAKIRAYGVIILIISKNHTSITGIWNTGKLPIKFAYPFSAR